MKIIRYRFLSCEVNHGTEDAPDLEQVFLDKVIECNSGEKYDDAIAVAELEAYNGAYTVEDVEPEYEEATADEVLDALLGVTE